MIDVGLLGSIAIMVIVVSVFVKPLPTGTTTASVLDIVSGPLLVGVLVGRLASMALDDPASMTNIRDVMIIRGGVEFWAGVAAGFVYLIVQARRDRVQFPGLLAAIAVPALLAWATFEATCVIRDGCPGPVASFGMRPAGLVQSMFPVGLVVAAAAVAGALVLRAAQRRGTSSMVTVLVAVGLVATIRSIASIWLPHVGEHLTRQHRTSIMVAGLAWSVLAVMLVRTRAEHRVVAA